MRASKHLLISVFFVMLPTFFASAQCNSSVKLSETKVSQLSQKGEIVLDVSTNGNFHGKVTRLDGVKEIVVDEFDGSQSRKITVENLATGLIYRVKVVFEVEREFLCKSKFIDDIKLGDTK